MEESMFKVVANKTDEVLYNDGEFLGRCWILIFKSEFNESSDIINVVNDMKTLVTDFKDNISEGYEWLNKQRDYRRINARKYIFMQDFDDKRKFKVYRVSTPRSFSSKPELPSDIPPVIEINSKEDMKNLINSGYEVLAFTSYKQYGKVIADYLISNADMYGIKKTAYELYEEWVHPKKENTTAPEYIDELEEIWNDIDKAGDELLKNDKDCWKFDGKIKRGDTGILLKEDK